MMFGSVIPSMAQGGYTIEFSLSKVNYTINESIKGNGKLLLNGAAPSNKSVTLVVKDERGASIYEVDQYTTGSEGEFVVNFKLPTTAPTGKYIIELKSNGVEKSTTFNIIKPQSPEPAPGNQTPAPDKKPEEKNTPQGKATVTKGEDGTITVELKVDNAKLSQQLEDKTSKKVSVNLNIEEGANKVVATFESKLMSEISQKGKNIEISTGDTTLEIDPKSVEVGTASTISLSVKKLLNDEYEEAIKSIPNHNLKPAAFIFDFDLVGKVDGKDRKIKFNKPISITVKYDESKITNSKKLGAYYFNEEENKWEYIGGKANSDGTVTFKVSHFSKYTIMEYDKTFGDIKNNWARKEIEILAAKHIVDGVGGDKYDPNSNITRGAFAKLLVYALHLESDQKGIVFEDVVENAWYAEAIKTASSLGIIQGYDGKVYPNKEITREEMAVMIIRALKHVRVTDSYEAQEVNFADSQSISSWAKEDVALAFEKGLVNGVGNNTFAPKDNATRAQSAVIIYRLLEILGEI